MNELQSHINELTTFMQTKVYASLDDLTKAALVRKKVDLCGKYFLKIAHNLNRNKYKAYHAPHKAVMIMTIMKQVESCHKMKALLPEDKDSEPETSI